MARPVSSRHRHTTTRQQGLPHDRGRHLRLPETTVAERDRDLGDDQPRPGRAPRVLDLEAVAVRDRVQDADARQCVAAEGLVTGRHVVHGEPEDQPDVDIPSPGDEPARQRPVAQRSAGDVARPDRDICRLERLEQGRESLRRVRQVGVHLDDGVVPGVERPREAGPVRRTEALLPRAAQQVHAVPVHRVGPHQIGGAVGAVVVDDQDVAVARCEHSVEQGPDVACFAVGRGHDE